MEHSSAVVDDDEDAVSFATGESEDCDVRWRYEAGKIVISKGIEEPMEV